MTNVKLPLLVRVPAYLCGLLFSGLGAPVVAFLLAEHYVDQATASLLIVVVGVVGTISAALSLSHLSLADDPAQDVPVTSGPVAQVETPSEPAADSMSDTPNPAARADVQTARKAAVKPRKGTP